MILLAFSSGGWIHGCAVHILQPLCTWHQFAKGHLNGSGKLNRPSCSLRAVHLHLGSKWIVSSRMDCFLTTCEGKPYTTGLLLPLLRLIYYLGACDPISLYRLEIRLVFLSLHCLRKRFATVHDKSATQLERTKN